MEVAETAVMEETMPKKVGSWKLCRPVTAESLEIQMSLLTSWNEPTVKRPSVVCVGNAVQVNAKAVKPLTGERAKIRPQATNSFFKAKTIRCPLLKIWLDERSAGESACQPQSAKNIFVLILNTRKAWKTPAASNSDDAMAPRPRLRARMLVNTGKAQKRKCRRELPMNHTQVQSLRCHHSAGTNSIEGKSSRLACDVAVGIGVT